MTLLKARPLRRHPPPFRGRVGDRGSATIELAILFPIFILLILVGVQGALIFYGRSVALAAAQKGANAESAYGAPAGAGDARAREYLIKMGDVLNDWEVTVMPVTEAGAEPTAVRVTVTGTTLGWLGLRFRVSQTAYAPLERFTTEVRGFTNSEALLGGN